MIGYQSGDISTITLINPERKNALSHEDFEALRHILDQVEIDNPRVVILTAVGDCFCAGVDFAALQIGDWAHDNPLNKLCNRVADLPMPVIAALNGHFIGGGAELAFCADFRFATPDAKCKIPAAAIGVHYEPSGIERVIDVVGKQLAKRLFLGLETFTGDALLTYGFVDGLSDEPLISAENYATQIVKLAPLSITGMKHSINADAIDNTQTRTRIAQCFASNDFQEAMASIADKRSPQFSGS